MARFQALLTDLADLAAAAAGGCEKNKVAFVQGGTRSSGGRGRDKSGGIRALVGALSLGGGGIRDCASVRLLASLCRLLAILCRFDDFRGPASDGGGGPTPDMTVSSSHDHVLEFQRQGVVPVLHRVTCLALAPMEAGGRATGPELELAAAALSATRALAVNDDTVQNLVAVGVLRSARVALGVGVGTGTNRAVGNGEGAADGEGDGGDGDGRPFRAPKPLASASLGLLRNLCGNDEIKTNLCLGTADGNAETSTVIPTILEGMKAYRNDATVQEHGCATLAAMALRKPANAKFIVEQGGPMAVLTAMRRHPNVVPVQRQGALAVRNISARLIKLAELGEKENTESAGTRTSTASDNSTPGEIDVREAFLDLGAEEVLRSIAGRHQGSVDEAYAALRDLGLKVSMIRYSAEGGEGAAAKPTGSKGVAMFGEQKAKFNPSFEESAALNGGAGMEERIALQAAASSGGM